MTRIILGCLAAILLAGCASPMVHLNVHSVPEGAAVIQNGAVVGTTPTVLTYDAKAQFAAGECLAISPLTVQWASGATQQWNGSLCPSVGYSQQYTFMRPANAPGGSLDAQVAAANAYQAAAIAAAQAQQDALQEQELYQAAGSLGNTLGCAAAGGCTPPPAAPSYQTAPPIQLPSAPAPFSNPPVTCRLDPTGTTATCQ